ncbi:hypothetical protein CCAX7_28180 [Capsulimonas corticalis]|uniref:Uncharacterized protein n=1 Tax=Capsulimonas corticalis TaxID=2219043 RepID=A0A402CTD1_9BACT|nr:hypothetical protein CCAX7_28180 [Capsulimonas corticalis]
MTPNAASASSGSVGTTLSISIRPAFGRKVADARFLWRAESSVILAFAFDLPIVAIADCGDGDAFEGGSAFYPGKF